MNRAEQGRIVFVLVCVRGLVVGVRGRGKAPGAPPPSAVTTRAVRQCEWLEPFSLFTAIVFRCNPRDYIYLCYLVLVINPEYVTYVYKELCICSC